MGHRGEAGRGALKSGEAGTCREGRAGWAEAEEDESSEQGRVQNGGAAWRRVGQPMEGAVKPKTTPTPISKIKKLSEY